MQNKVQNGKTVTILNSGTTTIKGGSPVVFGARIVIPVADIAPGDTGACETEGVYELPAITTAAFAQGDKVYYNPDAAVVTNAATRTVESASVDNPVAGVSWDDKGQTSAVAFVGIG